MRFIEEHLVANFRERPCGLGKPVRFDSAGSPSHDSTRCSSSWTRWPHAEDVRRVVETVEGLGLQAHAIPGAQRTAIGITGTAAPSRRAPSRTCPASRRSSRSRLRTSSSPGRPSGRTPSSRSEGCRSGGPEIVVVAGPCAVESEAQAIEIGHAVRKAGATLYRGGAFKPRTSPYSFQGLGAEGLKILARVRGRNGPADRDRGARHRDRGPRRGVRRLPPGRRPQHAELLAAEEARPDPKARCS